MRFTPPWSKLKQKWQEQQTVPKRQPVVFNSATQFQERRRQEHSEQRRKRINETWQRKRTLVLIAVGLAAMLIAASTGLYLLRSNSQFYVQHMQIRGVTAVAVSEVETALAWVKQESLYGLSLGKIQQDLLNKFPYFREVFVRKILPDELDIQVIERFPVMSYANLGTSLTLDEEGKVIGIFAAEEVDELPLGELNIMLGYGDPNSVLVEEKYLSGIADERARARVKWDEVKPEDKKRALDQVQQDLLAQADARLLEHTQKLGEQLMNSLPILVDYRNNNYQLGDTFDITQFDIAFNLFRYFQSRQIPIKKILWQTEFNILAVLPNNGRIMFTTSRPLEDQIAAVETIRKVEDLSRVNIIDVRSNVVSVR